MPTEKTVRTFSFDALPTTVAELKTLPEAAQADPFATAALAVLAACAYHGASPEACYDLFDELRGPAGALTPFARQFLRDRLAEYPYVPLSFLEGATPDNDYASARPYRVTVFDGPYSYQNDGYAALWLRSSGADTERPVTLRLAKDGRWYLWGDITFLSQVRPPESSNPWA